MGENALFVAKGVAIGYGRALLSGISLSIRRGEYWGIFGPNGGGKTTLVKTLLGAIPPVAGSVRRSEGLRLAYVPQLSSVRESLPLSVRQVVELGGLGLKDLGPASEALARVGLGDLERVPFGGLSGGQRQRVMVARALHRRPDVLVLDEPTNGVDMVTRHSLMHLLRALNREGMVILLVTHLLGEIGPEVKHFLWLDAREGLFVGGDREAVLGDPRLEEVYGAGLRAVDVGGDTVLAWHCEEGEVTRG